MFECNSLILRFKTFDIIFWMDILTFGRTKTTMRTNQIRTSSLFTMFATMQYYLMWLTMCKLGYTTHVMVIQLTIRVKEMHANTCSLSHDWSLDRNDSIALLVKHKDLSHLRWASHQSLHTQESFLIRHLATPTTPSMTKVWCFAISDPTDEGISCRSQVSRLCAPSPGSTGAVLLLIFLVRATCGFHHYSHVQGFMWISYRTHAIVLNVFNPILFGLVTWITTGTS